MPYKIVKDARRSRLKKFAVQNTKTKRKHGWTSLPKAKRQKGLLTRITGGDLLIGGEGSDNEGVPHGPVRPPGSPARLPAPPPPPPPRPVRPARSSVHDRQREIGEFERSFRRFKDEYVSLVDEITADAPDYHLGILWDYIDDNLPESELLVNDIEDEANALWDMYHDLVRKYPTHDMTHGQTRIRPDFALRNFAAGWNMVHRYFVEATTEEAINNRQWLREHEMAAAQHAAQLAAHQAALIQQGPNPIGYVSDSSVSDAERQAAQDPTVRRVRRRLNDSEDPDPESPYLSGNGKMINHRRSTGIFTSEFRDLVNDIKMNHERLRNAMTHLKALEGLSYRDNSQRFEELYEIHHDAEEELILNTKIAISELSSYLNATGQNDTMNNKTARAAKPVVDALKYLISIDAWPENRVADDYASSIGQSESSTLPIGGDMSDTTVPTEFFTGSGAYLSMSHKLKNSANDAADEYASTSHASNTSTVPIGGETSDSTIPNGGTLGSGAHLMLAQAMKGGARDPNAPGAPARPPRLPQPEWRQMAAEAIARGNARGQQPKPPYIPKYKKSHYLGGSFQFQLVKDSTTSLYNKIRREVTDPHSFTRKNAAPIALTAALLLSGAIASEMPANTKQEQLYRDDFYEKYGKQPYLNKQPYVTEI